MILRLSFPPVKSSVMGYIQPIKKLWHHPRLKRQNSLIICYKKLDWLLIFYCEFLLCFNSEKKKHCAFKVTKPWGLDSDYINLRLTPGPFWGTAWCHCPCSLTWKHTPCTWGRCTGTRSACFTEALEVYRVQIQHASLTLLPPLLDPGTLCSVLCIGYILYIKVVYADKEAGAMATAAYGCLDEFMWLADTPKTFACVACSLKTSYLRQRYSN